MMPLQAGSGQVAPHLVEALPQVSHVLDGGRGGRLQRGAQPAQRAPAAPPAATAAAAGPVAGGSLSALIGVPRSLLLLGPLPLGGRLRTAAEGRAMGEQQRAVPRTL